MKWLLMKLHKMKHFIWVLFIILGKLPIKPVVAGNGVLVYRDYGKGKGTKFMFALPLWAFEHVKKVI